MSLKLSNIAQLSHFLTIGHRTTEFHMIFVRTTVKNWVMENAVVLKWRRCGSCGTRLPLDAGSVSRLLEGSSKLPESGRCGRMEEMDETIGLLRPMVDSHGGTTLNSQT